MWHPHLKRDRIDDNKFQVINSRRNFEENFPIFLEMKNSVREKKENTHSLDKLNNEVIFNPKNNKMKCVCKFVLENKNFVNDEIRNLGITPIPKGKGSSKSLSQTKLNNGKFGKDNTQKNNNEIKNFPKKFMRNNQDESLINNVLDENSQINQRKNIAFSSRDGEKIADVNSQIQNNSNFEVNNLIKNNIDILPKNNYEEEEIQKKYLSIVNDIRKVQSPVKSGLKLNNAINIPQKQSFNNENLFLEKSNLEDLNSSLNLNLNKILNLKNLKENKEFDNSSDPKIFPIDISNYRLKEIESKISLPKNLKNNESKNFSINDIKINNISNQSNSKQNTLKNSNKVLLNDDNLFLDQNTVKTNNYLNSNKNEIRNKRFDYNNSMKNMISNLSFDSANFPQNSNLNNNNQQLMYKNILDYLAYNNQMMQNIQKLLFSNNAFVNNPIGTDDKTENFLLNNYHNIKSNFMTNPFTKNMRLNSINNDNDKFNYQSNYENNLKLDETFQNTLRLNNQIFNENRFSNHLKKTNLINNKQLQKDLFDYLNAKNFGNKNDNDSGLGSTSNQNDYMNNPYNKISENSGLAALSNNDLSNAYFNKNAYLNNNNINFNNDLLSRFLNIN